MIDALVQDVRSLCADPALILVVVSVSICGALALCAGIGVFTAWCRRVTR